MSDGTSVSILVITAVAREAEAVSDGVARSAAADEAAGRRPPVVHVVAGGVGRVNAALSVAASMGPAGRLDPADPRRVRAILATGVAGSLPCGAAPAHAPVVAVGGTVVGGAAVYHEEGLIGPDGFRTISDLGFPLGEFDGNRIPADPLLLEAVSAALPHAAVGPIATVATCSGTDAAAAAVVTRTRAVAEAMEGAAVLHAARRFGVPALEVRGISNTTGDRPRQHWDLAAGLAAVSDAVAAALPAMVRALTRPRPGG